MFGMILGLAAYVLYLKFLVDDQPTALSIGWIFFMPQYLVSWAASLLNLPEIVGLVVCYLSIMLFYGYLCLSVRLAPRLAFGTMLTSGVLFLALVHWQHVDNVFMSLAKFAFWPALVMGQEFDYIRFVNHAFRVLLECVTVAIWHTGLISGTHVFFLLTKRSAGNAPVHTADSTAPMS